MKQTMKKIGLATLVAGVLATPAEAQTISRLETDAGDRTRVEHFYDVAGVDGYTFGDFTDEGYFSRTFLSKDLGKGIGPRAEITTGSGMTDYAGIGIQKNISLPGEGAYGHVRFVPVSFDTKGQQLDLSTLGFAAGTGKGPLRLDAFADVDTRSGDWVYGEAKITAQVTDALQVGLQADLINQGGLMPAVKPGFIVSYTLR